MHSALCTAGGTGARGPQRSRWASPEMANALSTAPSPLPPLYLTYWKNSLPAHLPTGPSCRRWSKQLLELSQGS